MKCGPHKQLPCQDTNRRHYKSEPSTLERQQPTEGTQPELLCVQSKRDEKQLAYYKLPEIASTFELAYNVMKGTEYFVSL
jgi:hypothetical protein